MRNILMKVDERVYPALEQLLDDGPDRVKVSIACDCIGVGSDSLPLNNQTHDVESQTLQEVEPFLLVDEVPEQRRF